MSLNFEPQPVLDMIGEKIGLVIIIVSSFITPHGQHTATVICNTNFLQTYSEIIKHKRLK